MTLLFLGEQSEPAKAVRITEYLQHAIETSLSNFGATVDRRGILGRDQADVLFFEDTLLDRIKEFRSYLLKNDDISEAYHSTEQFPKWTPHLTLGYPKTPAKTVVGLEFDPTYVEFDRIAFWIEDFDGPEFRLKTPTPMEQKEMGMTANTDDFLTHYGVKGMKWGVRRSQAQLDRAAGRRSDRKTSKVAAKNNKKAAKRAKKDAVKARREKVNAAYSKAYAGNAKTVINDILLTNGRQGNIALLKASGYSRGKSKAIAYIGGHTGTLLASEIKIRRG